MPRPDHSHRPLLALMALGFALVVSTAQAQSRPATAASPPLARYVPKDNLIAVAEFTGLDSHSREWNGSALYKLLNETSLGALTEDVLGQLIDKSLANMPPIPDKPTAPQILGALKFALRKGFVVATYGKPPGMPSVVIAFRDVNTTEGKAAVGFLRKLMETIPNRESETRNGRKLTVVNGGAWWDEKDDLVIAPPPIENTNAILSVIDGKSASAATHPIRVELAKEESGFTPVMLAFVDPSTFPPMPPPAVALGLDGLKRVDLRWGFQDDAMLLNFRVLAPAPRRGVLAMLDSSTFTLQTLPPVPAGLSGFLAMSLDLDGIFGKYIALMQQVNPPVAQQLAQRQNAILATTGLDIRKDLLKHLGPKMSFSSKTLPGPGRTLAPGVTIQNSEMTFLAETDNGTAFAKTLDTAVGLAKQAMRPPNNAPPGAPPQPKIEKLTGADRGYELTIPAGPTLTPFDGAKPAVVVGKSLVALSTSLASAKQGLALEGTSAKRWTPPADYAAMAKRLPNDMILLSVSDPRESVPQLIAALPTLVPQIQQMMNQGRPGGPGAAPIRIDATKVPKVEEMSRRMSPSSLALVVDAQGLKLVSRDAVPTLTTPAAGGVAVALLLPAVQAAREAARRSQCVNNLKQIGLALHNYHSANDMLPPAAIRDKNGKALLSWRVAILPYIEQQGLYNEFHLDEPWDSAHNKPLIAKMPAVYHCPSDAKPQPGMTSYRVFTGKGGLFDDPKGVSFAGVTDGLSNTIAVAEFKEAVTWTKPDEVPVDDDPAAIAARLGSNHPGGGNVLFSDGSVRFIKTTIAPAILKALVTRNGGEIIQGGSF